MRAIIAHAPDADARELREFILSAGFQCQPEDCVAWDQLAARLARGKVDLLILRMHHGVSDHRDALQDALMVTSVPKLAVGLTDDRPAAELADYLRIPEFIDETNCAENLHQAIDRLRAAGHLAGHVGQVFSVFGPAPGSGATTVAVHLAASLAAGGKHGSVSLLELSREPGDLAVALDLAPRHTAENVCQRWQRLDQVGFRSSLCEHALGIHILANAVDGGVNSGLNSDAVRRITVLSRISFDNSVIALDGDVAAEAVTAMRLSDAVLMVVRPDVPAVRRARRACEKAIEGGVERDRLCVVVNRWGQRGQLGKDQIESSLGIKLLDFIPDDPGHVNRAMNEGRLLHDFAGRSRIVRRFNALATALLNGTVADSDG